MGASVYIGRLPHLSFPLHPLSPSSSTSLLPLSTPIYLLRPHHRKPHRIAADLARPPAPASPLNKPPTNSQHVSRPTPITNTFAFPDPVGSSSPSPHHLPIHHLVGGLTPHPLIPPRGPLCISNLDTETPREKQHSER